VFLPEVQNEVAVGAVQLRSGRPKESVVDFVNKVMNNEGGPKRGAARAAPPPLRRGSPDGDGFEELTTEQVLRRLHLSRLHLNSPTSAEARQRAASGNTSPVSPNSSVGPVSADSEARVAGRHDDHPDDRLEYDFDAIEQRLRLLSAEALAQLDHSWFLYCHKQGLRIDEDSWKSFLAMREANGGTDHELKIAALDSSLPEQQLNLSPPDDDALPVEVLYEVASTAFWQDWKMKRAEMRAEAKAGEFDKAIQIQKGLTTLLRAEMQYTKHLEKFKQDAVQEQEFEAAAQIRDEIKRLAAAVAAARN